MRASHWIVPLLLASSTAMAQIKPKIMIIFDTSGSMMRDSSNNAYQGDGSPLCSSVGQQTRIYQLKTALFDVLQGIGAQEIDFALATYPMMVDATRTPQCLSTCMQSGIPCSGHYYVVPAQTSEIYTDYFACKISTHTPSTQTDANCSATTNPCAAWYADYKKEVLKVPFGSQPENVMLYFDQKEDTTALPAGQALTNPEVRAAWNWFTPLGKSLFYAYGYFDKEVALPTTDYRKACEKLVIAMFTDGGETCNDSSSNAFYPTKWATNLNTNPKLKVTTHTIAIDTTEGLVQAIATAGKGSYYSVAGNTTALKAAFLDIIAKSQPPSETCNNKDDDCDNLVDEDFPLKGQPCNNGKLGVCYKTGTYVCNTAGTGVVCNAPNATGTTEICNGLDDDCDGMVDEGLTNCNPICQPEICNGLDDDCDGKIDNNIPSVACGKDVGECKAGVTECVAGKLNCKGGTLPKTEICNGLDDDCDGTRDGFAEPCYSFASGCDLTTGVCKGICKLGTKLCTAVQTGSVWSGAWGACTGEVGPAKEICDGIDNNCDGVTDEQAECPGGVQCVNGACSQPCNGSEFSCPTGLICKNGWCIQDPCDVAQCSAKGWVCKAGECIDPCLNVTCPGTEVCVKGACVDTSCYSKGCPVGQRCVQGTCKTDPCAGVTCGAGAYCLDGKCLTSCETINCRADETCRVIEEGGVRKTACVKDPCLGVECKGGDVCVQGKCVSDPCSACSKGQVCADGKCVIDLCELVTCPQRQTCVLGSCLVANVESTRDLLATGGGGCACQLGDAPQTPWTLLLIMLGAMLLGLTRRD
jgi:hypothetical protein